MEEPIGAPERPQQQAVADPGDEGPEKRAFGCCVIPAAIESGAIRRNCAVGVPDSVLSRQLMMKSYTNWAEFLSWELNSHERASVQLVGTLLAMPAAGFLASRIRPERRGLACQPDHQLYRLGCGTSSIA